MWAAGVVILEMYAGGLAGLKAAGGDNALELLETCARNTSVTPTSTENTRQTGKGSGGGESATGRGREQTGAEGGVGRGSPQGNGGPKKRNIFRVDMPEGVLAVLREIFQQEAGDRPESMEVRKAYVHPRSPICRGYGQSSKAQQTRALEMFQVQQETWRELYRWAQVSRV